MKKLATLAIVVGLGLASTSAMAGIKNTKHDLSTTSTNMGGITSGGSNQLCIYCHTPHNAAPAIPLWNRTDTQNSGYKFYSSPSMKLHKGAVSAFESTSTSLQCMSCHNGVDGLYGSINKNGGTGAAIVGTNTTGSGNITNDLITGAANLGKTLENDHPVNLQMQSGTAGLFNPIAGNTIGSAAITTKLPLFKGLKGDNYIECGSCHSVHDNTNLKFLRTSNKGSILCLACHDK